MSTKDVLSSTTDTISSSVGPTEPIIVDHICKIILYYEIPNTKLVNIKFTFMNSALQVKISSYLFAFLFQNTFMGRIYINPKLHVPVISNI